MAHAKNPNGGADHAANRGKRKITSGKKQKPARSPKGDTGRTSSQGRKEASGGSKNTNNRGQAKGR